MARGSQSSDCLSSTCTSIGSRIEAIEDQVDSEEELDLTFWLQVETRNVQVAAVAVVLVHNYIIRYCSSFKPLCLHYFFA